MLSAVIAIVNMLTVGATVSASVIVTESVAAILTLPAASRTHAYRVTDVGVSAEIDCSTT